MTHIPTKALIMRGNSGARPNLSNGEDDIGRLFYDTDTGTLSRWGGLAWESVEGTGGGSGAPTDAQYVTLAANAGLSGERVLTAGDGISLADGGAGAAVTIAAKGGGVGSLQVVIGDGASAVTTGVKGFVEIPYDCLIIAVRLVGDAAGSIVVDIWKDVFANFPPAVADTITAAAKPTLASAQKYEDVVLTGWTKTISRGDWLAINVDSASTVKQVTLSLTLVRL